MKKLQLGRKKTIIASLIIGLIIIGSSFSVWALSTNKGIVVSAPQSAPEHVPAIATLDGTYVYFKYSDIYKIESPQPNNGNLETYDFVANTNYEKHLAVAVQHLDVTGLSNFPNYTARDSRADIYDKQRVTVGHVSADEFTKKDHTEKTIFILRGNTVAIFSFVTASRYDDVDREITAILNSFIWKQ